ncbi:MAG: hypothetical protein ABSC47_09965 [Terracidiphilus sp.]|jgi:hypothetical protein
MRTQVYHICGAFVHASAGKEKQARAAAPMVIEGVARGDEHHADAVALGFSQQETIVDGRREGLIDEMILRC